MHSSLVYLTIVFLVNISKGEITEEEDVLVLTTENFQEAIDDNTFIMVEFYAPWCGHCKALAPEYAKAAGLLKEENSEIKLAKMDATESKEIASKYGVGGYPTLKFFKSGQVTEHRFRGERKADSIVSWLKKKSGPSATSLTSLDETKKFIEGKEVVVIGFFSDQKDFAAKNFLKAAEELDDMGFTFGITSELDVFSSYDLTDDGIVLFKSFDEGRNDFKGDPLSVEKIKNFVIKNSLPLLIEFKHEYASRIYFESSKIGALYLIVSSTSDEYSSQKEMADKIAKEYKGKMLTIIMDSEDDGSQRFLDLLGVQQEEVPVMRFAYGWSVKYMPESTGITEDKIKQFVTDTFAGKTQKLTWSKTEEIPDDWDKESVKVLVGKNFHDVISKTKNVFVEFYAPWCGHCKALTPIWEELGEMFKDRKDIMIAKMEATSNSVDNVRVSSYPTLFLFKGGSNANEQYREQRTLENLTKFLADRGIKMKDEKKKKEVKEEL